MSARKKMLSTLSVLKKSLLQPWHGSVKNKCKPI
jgi:hypothetical protein